MDKMPERPPFVRFQSRPVEDRDATTEAGHVVYKDVDFALITPAGSKDVHEAIATEWLLKVRAEAKSGRIPSAWITHFESVYEAWKKDEEPPVSGTRLTHWPALNQSQLDMLRSIRVQTVEDVANMNEEAIARLGMGGRSLKQRAEAFLEARSGPAAQGEKLAALQVENELLKEQMAELNRRLDALQPPQEAKQPTKTAIKV